MENINKEDFEINVDNINVEEIMNMIRKNIKEKGYKEHESINNFNFISENKGVNEIQEDFESLHYLWNINLEREIKSKNKLFAFIKKIIRKLSRWYIKPIIEDQIIFNSIVVRTNSYLKSKLKETKEQLSNNTEEMKKILNEIKIVENRLLNSEKNLKNVEDDLKNMEKEKIEISEELLKYESYSQCGEDKIIDFILSYLGENKGLSYLDIGCNNYKKLNNTYNLYKKGIRGVLIDANPLFIEDIRKYRPGDTVLNCGIGLKNSEEMKFYVLNPEADGLSSFNLESIKEAQKQNPYIKIEKEIKVPVHSLDHIYKEYFATVPTIVSMDVEGVELDILKSSDFEKYRPLIFIIETIEYSPRISLTNKEQNIIDFMKEKDYVEYAFTGVNSIFVDKRRI